MNSELLKKEKKHLKHLVNDNLETERLFLFPLQPISLVLATEDYTKMQMELGLKVSKTALDEELQYAMKIRLKRVLEDVEHCSWLTNWAVIHKEENLIVGFLILKGLPNENGEVIMGYSIEENYRNMGYATEALRKLVGWIFENPKVFSIIADTEATNLPSHKVLSKLGAVPYKKSEDLLWWKIER